MDWTMPVNQMLDQDICKLNCNLRPPNFRGDQRELRVLQTSLSRVIDFIGEQSSAAQGLNKTITTADKLRSAPKHYLYLMKDPHAKGGSGDLIGLLKVGFKNLFLFDEQNKMCEVEPLCILDFFIVKDRQRAGYGKILFDYMLEDMQCKVTELAIDGPSDKMKSFLAKNYGLNTLIRQSNNFAVAREFFETVSEISKIRRDTPVEPAVVGRFAATTPRSGIAAVIHGVNNAQEDKRNMEEFGEAHQTEVGADRVEIPPPPLPELEVKPEVIQVEPQRQLEPELEIAANNTKSPERPCTLSVEPVVDSAVAPAVSPAGSTVSRRGSQLTEQGFFDVKFYHNKLW